MSENHPEDCCQRCGRPNPVWSVDSDRFNTACHRTEIVCPSCFVFAHEEATGMRTVWQLTPAVPFRWIKNEGRSTPFVSASVTDSPVSHDDGRTSVSGGR